MGNGLVWVRFVDDGEVPPRVGFAVTRSIGTAVVRNRIRRRLRALLDASAIPAGTWLIGVTPRAVSAGHHELGEALSGALATTRTAGAGRSR